MSITLKYFAIAGVCFGRSVALPPQMIITSISSFIVRMSLTEYTFTPSVRRERDDGSLRVNTAFSSISGLCLTAHSTPLPRFPYPRIPILMLIILSSFLLGSFSRMQISVPATVKSILYEIFLCKRKHSRKKQPAGAVKIHQLPETRASEFFLPYKFKLGL